MNLSVLLDCRIGLIRFSIAIALSYVLIVLFLALLDCGTLFRIHVYLPHAIFENLHGTSIDIFCLPETFAFIHLSPR